MKISWLGLCRGKGKIFIKVRVEGISQNSEIEVAAFTAAGDQLPSCKYPAKALRPDRTCIVTLPILKATQTLVIRECDESGSVVSEWSKRLTSFRVTWESRYTYRINPALAKEFQGYDGEYSYELPFMRFLECIHSEDGYILRALAVVPPAVDPAALQIVCLDEHGLPVVVEPVFLGTGLLHPSGCADFQSNAVEASIKLPSRCQNYCFVLADGMHPECVGFSVLEAGELARFLACSSATMQSAQGDVSYEPWFKKNKVSHAELEKQRLSQLSITPRFSIVVPLYKTPLDFLREMVESVVSQSYGGWELLLVNASPEDQGLGNAVKQYAASDPRIKVIHLQGNGGISANTNEGLSHASGDFICFFDHDDMLEPNILFEYACAINLDEEIDLMYCDEDKVREDKYHFDPFFKPDFNLDLLRNNNYICHLLCVRKALIDEIGFLDPMCDGAQDHDLTLRAIEKARSVHHVDKVLYHWRVSETSVAGNAGNKSYATDAGILAVKRHLERVGLEARVEPSRRPFTYRVTYGVPCHQPLVSIVVTGSNDRHRLGECIDSILAKTSYPNFEILIVGDGDMESEFLEQHEGGIGDARVRVLRCEGEAGCSKTVNFGVTHSGGEYCIFLSGNTQIITHDWIEAMLGVCSRGDVGAVGVKLYYPDDTIRHAGLSVTPEVVGRLHHRLPRSNWGYFALNDAQQDMSAVSGACIMSKKSDFVSVGGFSEELNTAFGDVDYCLKLREKNLLVVYTPEVELYHFESIIRNNDKVGRERIKIEEAKAYMRSRWAKYYVLGDPYFNRNLLQYNPQSFSGALYFQLPTQYSC